MAIQDSMVVLKGLWSRKVWILIPLVLGICGSLVALRMAEPEYWARALLMVEPQKVPSDYVKTTVTTKVQDRLKTLEQQVKRRASLEQLIEQADLYPDLRDDLSQTQLVALARDAVSVRVQRSRIVSIGFSGYDPEAVARAANGIAEMIIEENLSLREQQAENTTAFLNVELERTKGMLEEQERLVSEYRLKHDGSLPSQRESNLAAIAVLDRKLESIRASREELELRRLLLERTDTAPVDTMEVSKPTKMTRLQELELRLLELRSQYTDKHPDVVRLTEEINRLKGQQPPPTVEVVDLDPTSEEDLIKQSKLDTLDLDMQRLNEDREDLLSQMAVYQRRLEATPRVEQQLISLTRDYDNLQRSYQSLLAKQIEARLAEELERQQQSEQIRVLEWALPPSSPFYPNRLIFLAVGLLLGGGLGVGLALIREYADQTFVDEDSLRREFPGVPIVIGIPVIDIGNATEDEEEEWSDQRSA